MGLSEKFNLEKQTGYVFNKWIFRIAFLIVLVYLIALIAIVGIPFRVYFHCPAGGMVCENEMYGHCTITSSWQLDVLKSVSKKSYDALVADVENFCKVKYFMPNEDYGKKPSWWESNFGMITGLILIAAMFINDVKYNKNWRGNVEEDKD